MDDREVLKPKVGTTVEVPLGHQVEFGKNFNFSVVYCGMPNPDVYCLGIRGRILNGSLSHSYPVYVPTTAKTLDTLLEGTAGVEVLSVKPMSITLKYVK